VSGVGVGVGVGGLACVLLLNRSPPHYVDY